MRGHQALTVMKRGDVITLKHLNQTWVITTFTAAATVTAVYPKKDRCKLERHMNSVKNDKKSV